MKRKKPQTTDPRELEFAEFCKTHYREHARRMASFRREAKTAKFFYPLICIAGFGIPVAAIVYGLQVGYRLNIARVQEVLPLESYESLVPLLQAAVVFSAFLGLLVGISWAMSKSRQLIFDAESLDLKVRAEHNARTMSEQLDALRLAYRHQSSPSTSRRSETGASHATPASHDDFEDDPLARLLTHHEGREDVEYEA